MAVQRMAILVEYRVATIWSRTAKAEFEEFLATGRVVLDAESAFPAGRPRHHDVITRPTPTTAEPTASTMPEPS
jgi:hypothetical protein